MGYMKTNTLVWVLPLLVIETVFLSGDLIVRGSTYHTFNTLPLFLMLIFSAEFMYFRGFKYVGISVLVGLLIGILKMNYIFYFEDLSGQGTMNGAYALFTCLYKGVFTGFIVDAAFIVSKKHAEIWSKLRSDKVNRLKSNRG